MPSEEAERLLAEVPDEPSEEMTLAWVDASGMVGFSFVGGVKRWWTKVDGKWEEYADG